MYQVIRIFKLKPCKAKGLSKVYKPVAPHFLKTGENKISLTLFSMMSKVNRYSPR